MAWKPSSFEAWKPSSFESAEDERPTEIESAARGLAHGGTFGFAPAIAGAGSALLDELKGDKRTLGEAYQAEREDSRKKFEAAKEANPIAYGAGDVAGSIGSGLALAPLTGGASVAGAVGAGALAGGLQAAGDSVSENADLGEGVKNVAKGAALGGALGGLGSAGGKVAGAALKKVAPKLSGALEDLSASQANRHFRGGASALSPGQQLSREQLLRAVDEGIIKPGGNLAGSAERSAAMREAAGRAQQGIENQLTKEGVTMDAGRVAKQLHAEADRIEAGSLGQSPEPAVYRKAADSLLKHADTSAGDLNATIDAGATAKKALQAQAEVAYGQEGGASLVGKAQKAVAGTFTDALKNDVAMAGEVAGPNSKVGELAKAYEPALKNTGDLIAITNVAKHGARLAANRNLVGLSGSTAALTAAATGHPIGAMQAIGGALLRPRLTSTVAVAARSAGKGVARIAHLAATNPAALGNYGGVLSRAVLQGPAQFATTNFVLAQDPGYQQLIQHHDEQGGE